MPDEVNAKSRRNVWWKCNTCDNEWKSVINARVKGTVCPVCADRAVLAGYNDLATTDRKLLAEWDYEKNSLLPTQVSRKSMKSVWWKCSLGHSWKAKISDRTILREKCTVCKSEYRSVFPGLAVAYYANQKGLKVQLGSDKLLGIPLETYITKQKMIKWNITMGLYWVRPYTFINLDSTKRGCYFNVNTTKTPAGRRKVPMLGFVKEAFLMEKERQELLDLHCEATVDGYTDFIFINRFGQPQHQATLNKAIRRIIRDCNDEQLLKDENAEVLLPHFSCHSLRHTFTTRMCEAGVNVKVIQDTLGHKDISTTLNIYTDVTKELRKSEFEGLDSYFKNEYNKVSV